jgi:hypothetical protein
MGESFPRALIEVVHAVFALSRKPALRMPDKSQLWGGKAHRLPPSFAPIPESEETKFYINLPPLPPPFWSGAGAYWLNPFPT